MPIVQDSRCLIPRRCKRIRDIRGQSPVCGRRNPRLSPDRTRRIGSLRALKVCSVEPQLLRAARPLPARRQAVICLANTPLTLLTFDRTRNTWLTLSFPSFLSKGKERVCIRRCPKGDFKACHILKVQLYRTDRGLSPPAMCPQMLCRRLSMVFTKRHFFPLPFVSYGQGEEIGLTGETE